MHREFYVHKNIQARYKAKSKHEKIFHFCNGSSVCVSYNNMQRENWDKMYIIIKKFESDNWKTHTIDLRYVQIDAIQE